MQKSTIPSTIPHGWAPLSDISPLVEDVQRPSKPITAPPMAMLLRCVELWLGLRSEQPQMLLGMRVDLRAGYSNSLWARSACLGLQTSRIEIREFDSEGQWNSLGTIELERTTLTEDFDALANDNVGKPRKHGFPAWLVERCLRIANGQLPAEQVRSIAEIVSAISDAPAVRFAVDWTVSQQAADVRLRAA